LKSVPANNNNNKTHHPASGWVYIEWDGRLAAANIPVIESS